ncbi:hypothetical protein [Microbacterium sp. KNMS]
MSDETPEIFPDGSWTEAVEAFVADAPWLTGRDQPQVKALRSIAAALDAGTFQAALISQFTLVHRGLLDRAPKGQAQVDDLEAAVHAMEHNPGVFWRAS